MRRTIILVMAMSLLLTSGVVAQPSDEDSIYQASTLDALLNGQYDGDMTYGQLRQFGDLGVGTFDALDGEMVAVDGEFYRVDTSGVAHIVADDVESPFAAVTVFEADETLSIDELLDCASLQTRIDELLPSPDLMVAIRVEGEFASLTTRSVPKQEPPFVGLAEALEDQVTFEFADISGVMVGFWLPEYLSGVNVAGYHFHFVDDARITGGHVLACEAATVTVEIDISDELRLVLPSANGIQ